MDLIINGHNYKYETEKVIRLFYPHEKILFLYDSAVDNNRYILTDVSDTAVTVDINIDNCHFTETKKIVDNQKVELIIAGSVFKILQKITGRTPRWGLMTGIRPTKLYRSFKNSSDINNAVTVLKDNYLISDEKLKLCTTVSDIEETIINQSNKNSYSLYISIPFCPTRCRYCSFVSHSIEKTARLIPEYIDKLIEELKITSIIASNLNLKLETVYIGGGTPTVLQPVQLEKILIALYEYFDMSNIKEFTVEAGRPDTVTAEKLQVLKKYNVTRISINPQTFNDVTLARIGRNHTSLQTENAFNIARSVGFDNINMDLIAGLEGESYDDFVRSVNKVLYFCPESVTIHTLSLKTASYLAEDGDKLDSSVQNDVSKMLSFGYKQLFDSGYMPYYMYRQSKTIDNLENTGWSLKGKECLYNVFMMDETHTVLAVGGGAVTKLKQPNGDYIDRIFNFKFPYEYINRFDELIDRKQYIYDFYERFK